MMGSLSPARPGCTGARARYFSASWIAAFTSG